MKKQLLTVVTATLMSGLISGSAFAACTAPINMGSQKIINLAPATANTDAVTYGQVIDALKNYRPAN